MPPNGHDTGSTLLPTLICSVSFSFHRLQFCSCLTHALKQGQIQGQPVSHPGSSLCMIPLLIVRIGMYQGAQRASMDHQPRDERPELLWSEQVHFKHGHRVWPNGSVPYLVDTKLWELSADTLPEFNGEFHLILIVLSDGQC